MHKPDLHSAAHSRGRASSRALLSYMSTIPDMFTTPVSTQQPSSVSALSLNADMLYIAAVPDAGSGTGNCVQACAEHVAKCGKHVFHMCTRIVNRAVTKKFMHRIPDLHTSLSAGYPDIFPRAGKPPQRSHTRLIPSIHIANNRYYGKEIRDIFRELWRREK